VLGGDLKGRLRARAQAAQSTRWTSSTRIEFVDDDIERTDHIGPRIVKIGF
jgi:hypothetical protein